MTVTSQAIAPPARASLTVPQGAALSIGAVLGTGVISLPALAADLAGPASLLAWLALVLLSVPLAGTFAALGARYPDGGGVSTYARRAFGRRAAAMVGWCFYFAVPFGAPAAAMFAGHYVADVLGGGMRTALTTAVAVTLVVGLANYLGLKVSGRLQLALASVLILLLVAAAVAALPYADPGNLRPFAPHGWAAVGSAAALLVWAFAGWEAVSSLAADYRRPERELPRATAVTVVVVGVLYLAIAAASILVLGSAAGSSAAPLSDLLALGIGGPVREITAVVAVLLTIGAMNAYFAGAAKLGAALGRDGALPTWFARGSAAGEIPRRSLLVVATLALVSLAAFGLLGLAIEALVLLTTGVFSLVYVVGTASAVRLLPRGTWARRAAVVALVAVLGLLALTGPYVVWALLLAAAGLGFDTYANRSRRGRPVPPG
ncbi:MAG TPA: amino acid permease [Propionibacteriaceae bacterium]|nr:amino acid permease [Propionibacteriaceae bacterium]